MGHPLYGKRQGVADFFLVPIFLFLVIFMSAWFDSIILGGAPFLRSYPDNPKAASPCAS